MLKNMVVYMQVYSLTESLIISTFILPEVNVFPVFAQVSDTTAGANIDGSISVKSKFTDLYIS